MKYVIALLFLVALTMGCTGAMTRALVVENGDQVAVDYTGRLENGTVFDSSVGRQPLEFTAGAGQMIKGFDNAVIGMKINETRTVTIAPDDAYGSPREDLIVDIPVENVPNGTKTGDQLQSGFQVVTVVKVNSTTVTIDANHELAGKTLVFDIKIVDIDKAK